MSEMLVSVKDLRVSYGERPVLKRVDLKLSSGEALYVAGENGSGKTSLLLCLAGLKQPSSGSIHVLGERFTAVSAASRQHLGVVLHEPLMHAELSVAENLKIFARAKGQDLRDNKELLCALGVEKLLSKRTSELSRGQIQRATITRALLGSPPLLIMDEPFNALDSDYRAVLTKLLQDQLNAGAGLIFTTHHEEQAEGLNANVVKLERGYMSQLPYGSLAGGR